MTPDPNLRQFGTPRMQEVLDAFIEAGSARGAAKKLKCHHSLIRFTMKALAKRAAQRGYAPEHGLTHALPEGLILRGTSIDYDNDGNVRHYWNKSKLEGRDREEAAYVPDPKSIKRTATLFDQSGMVAQQWVTEEADAKKKAELWRATAEAMAEALPRVEPVARVHPAAGPYKKLAVAYPVGDHHLGMLSWEQETGSNYNLEIGEEMLAKTSDYLMGAAPEAALGVIIFLGDFLHYDSFEAVTPTSRNMLDADSRYPKMVRAAIRSMRRMIQRALEKHEHVHVIVEIGNHDLSSSIFLMECLSNIYENEPRITVDTSPAHYHYLRFGKTLLGVHHGHGAKMKELPLIMARDRPEDWGASEFRYWYTGHIHHDSVGDFGGVRVESFRVLPPTDAWASQKGYRASREMKAIVLHEDHGEVARGTANPSMFEFQT